MAEIPAPTTPNLEPAAKDLAEATDPPTLVITDEADVLRDEDSSTPGRGHGS